MGVIPIWGGIFPLYPSVNVKTKRNRAEEILDVLSVAL